MGNRDSVEAGFRFPTRRARSNPLSRFVETTEVGVVYLMHILAVEDDAKLADVVRRGFVRDGHDVDVYGDGREALDQSRHTAYDAIILDIVLPGCSGIEVCRNLRAQGNATPILMLTARDTIDDIVAGLEAGAEDYLTKPFAFPELRARLLSVARRGVAAQSRITAGELVLDLVAHEAYHAGSSIALTEREFQVLAYLMQHAGRVLTRTMIEVRVWGDPTGGPSNPVDVYIKRLRSKLDSPGSPSAIETIRGIGYRIRDVRT